MRVRTMSSESAPAHIEDLLAHADWLQRLAAHVVRGDGDPEDVVQDTWLAALRAPPDIDRPAPPWLAKVLRNFARKRWQATRSRRVREAQAVSSATVPSPETLVERAQAQRKLAELVLALPDPYRGTVLLRYFEGLSAAEIAVAQDTPAGTIRWRLKEALERLREQLDAEDAAGRSSWRRAFLPLVPRLGETVATAGPTFGAGTPAPSLKALMIAAACAGAGALVVTSIQSTPSDVRSAPSDVRTNTARPTTASALVTPTERPSTRSPAAPPLPEVGPRIRRKRQGRAARGTVVVSPAIVSTPMLVPARALVEPPAQAPAPATNVPAAWTSPPEVSGSVRRAYSFGDEVPGRAAAPARIVASAADQVEADRVAIRRLAREKAAIDLRACQQSAAASKPRGRLEIQFTVTPAGEVGSAVIMTSKLNDPALEGCTLGSIRRWTFPAPSSGRRVIVYYPLSFSRDARVRSPDVLEYIATYNADVKDCYSRWLVRNPAVTRGFRETVALLAQFADDGRLRSLEIANASHRKTPEVEACISEKARAWHFGDSIFGFTVAYNAGKDP